MRIVAVFIIFCSMNSATGQGEIDLTVTENGIGKIQLGTSLENVANIFGQARVKKTFVNGEGNKSPAVEVYDRPEGSILFIAEEGAVKGKIWRIEVLDKSLKTLSGVSVGDTLAKVQSKHKIKFTMGEGNVAAATKNGYSFLLDRTTMPEILNPAKLKNQIPESARVKSILLVGKR